MKLFFVNLLKKYRYRITSKCSIDVFTALSIFLQGLNSHYPGLLSLDIWIQISKKFPVQEKEDNSYYNGMTQKQVQIYESALEVFAEKGYAGSSTGEIAKKAGVAEGLIFRHFKNKKQLFQKIAFMVIEKTLVPLTVKRTEKIFEKDYTDIRDFLSSFFQERTEFIKEHKSFLRIIVQEISFDEDIQKFARKQFESKMLPLVKEFILRHQEKKVMNPGDPSIIVRMIMSSFFSYAIIRFIWFPEEEWNDKKQLEETINIICSGISAKK